MSSPGGSGNQGPNEQQPHYGHRQPHPDATGGHPVNPDTGPSGMQYRGFGVFDQSAPPPPKQPPADPFNPVSTPPPRRRTPWIIGIGAAVVAIGGITTAVLLFNGGSDEHAEPVPTTSRAAPSNTPTSAPEPAPAEPPVAVVPGWQPVVVPARGAVYDVPPDWVLDEPDARRGWGTAPNLITISGIAEYGKGYCPEDPQSFRAVTGTTARRGGNDAEVAADTARDLATLAYGVDGRPPRMEVTEPEPLRLAAGKINGMRVTATVRHPDPRACGAPSTVIEVFAANNEKGASVVHIGLADQEVPDALPLSALNTIMTSIRPR